MTMKVDRRLLPKFRYCVSCGHKVRSCDHMERFEVIDRIVDELGVPTNEKEVNVMAKRFKKELF